ncbi:pirin family protein [Mucilaginibacter sp. Bleaf8]|uniref:pirin family protein n=1 Tax=Mucilaginibacter sp. Bleaf8 TaxID=2834430 RepID=UPI001BD048F9|nr:pirin family protein [Mucilaginibacter sp. Bleaf8]MBS7564080.1 pirin family protein [Mucilaginibacter sp. Bleaf8]
MKKTIIKSSGGQTARVADMLVNRLLPDMDTRSIGPFVFLDHLFPVTKEKQEAMPYQGENAHPHRGIATFSYLFSGALEHFDSQGNHDIVEAGGAQWMKAGSGIVHDERPGPEFLRNGGVLHALQFWINLPAKNKAEVPEYLAVKPTDIPEAPLPGEAGIIRVVIGACGDMVSPVKTYTRQFIYHIRLNPKSAYTFTAKAGMEHAIFVPVDEVTVNGQSAGKSELLLFGNEGDELELYNPGVVPANLIIFGGESYTEPIVAEGPFVMNTRMEVAQAYNDFFEGKYGTIQNQI